MSKTLNIMSKTLTFKTLTFKTLIVTSKPLNVTSKTLNATSKGFHVVAGQYHAHALIPRDHSLTPLPVIHTTINSLPPSENLLCLLGSPSGNTYNLLLAFASVSFATSAILALFGSDLSPLSTPCSLVATFALL